MAINDISRKLSFKLKTLALDLRHGGLTGGLRITRHELSGANPMTSTHIALLPYLLDPVLKRGDVFVDVGCGKGRVLNWVIEDGRAAYVFGLEIEKKVAASLCRRYSDIDRVTIVAGDGVNALPDAATLFYLWNPFKRDIMTRFRDTLVEKYTRLDRLSKVKVLYHNCVDADLWRACPQASVTDIAPTAESDHKTVLVSFHGAEDQTKVQSQLTPV